MLRRDWFPALAFGAAIALALPLYSLLRSGPSRPTVPRTLEQIARMAEGLGLHHRSDIESGVITSRLVISDRPLTFDRANSLHIGDPDHACWRGTVAACGDGLSFPYLCNGDHGVLWGDILLYGDPALIRQLMAAPVPDDDDGGMP